MSLEPLSSIAPRSVRAARAGAAPLVGLAFMASLLPAQEAEAASSFSATARGELSAVLTLTGDDIASLSQSDVDFGDLSFGLDEDDEGRASFGGSQEVSINPASLSGSGFAKASVSGALPFGTAYSTSDSFVYLDLFNSTSGNLFLGLTYTILTNATVSFNPAGSGIAGAEGFAEAYVFAESAIAGVVLDAYFDAEACVATLELADPLSCPVGSTSVSQSSGVTNASFAFTIAPGDDISMEFGAFALTSGLVAPVPLPAGAGLLLTGLSMVGALRLRRRGAVG
jgi:hypothetical protein